jgi:hypothetical protein
MATNFSNRRSRQLGFQPLEERTLMAGDVGAVLTNGTLTLTGDADANDVAVYQQINNGVPVPGTFIVSGLNGTTINHNGSSSGYLTGVNNISASLGGSGDHLALGLVSYKGTPTPFNLAGNLSIDMGSGENKVDLIGTTVGGDATINSGDLYDQISIRGSFSNNLNINPNGGGDLVSVGGTSVQNDLNIAAGTDNGNDIVLISNTKVGHDMKIDMGPSTSGLFYDTLQIDHLTVNHDLTLLGGAGKHSYSITDSKIKDALFATLGGDDGINIANTTVTTKTDLRLGGGNDQIRITDSNFGNTLIIDVGSSHYVFRADPSQTGGLFIHSFSYGV